MGTLIRAKPAAFYDADYYLHGRHSGKSSYENYRADAPPGWVDPLADWIVRYTTGATLELACCYGHLVRAVSDRGRDALGLEWSPWVTAQAVTPRVSTADACEAPDRYQAGQFGLLLSLDFLEHLTPADGAALIPRLGGLVAPNGLQLHLIGACAAADRIMASSGPAAPAYEDQSHVNTHTLDWYEDRFAEAGWVVDLALTLDLRANSVWCATDWHDRLYVFRRVARRGPDGAD